MKEVSPESYYDFLIQVLEAERYISSADFKQMVIDRFNKHWTEPDFVRIKGKAYPKWENNLAWAKSLAAKRGLVTTVQRGRDKYLVYTDHSDSYIQLLRMAFRSNPKRGFTRKCENCETVNPLVAESCSKCGTPFPESPAKRYVGV